MSDPGGLSEQEREAFEELWSRVYADDKPCPCGRTYHLRYRDHLKVGFHGGFEAGYRAALCVAESSRYGFSAGYRAALAARDAHPLDEPIAAYRREMATAREESPKSQDGWRLYVLLALFDRRDGSALGDLVQAAREGYERSAPDMREDDAWASFDALWERLTSQERLKLTFAREDTERPDGQLRELLKNPPPGLIHQMWLVGHELRNAEGRLALTWGDKAREILRRFERVVRDTERPDDIETREPPAGISMRVHEQRRRVGPWEDLDAKGNLIVRDAERPDDENKPFASFHDALAATALILLNADKNPDRAECDRVRLLKFLEAMRDTEPGVFSE